MLSLGLSPTCSGLLLSTRPLWWMMDASTQAVRVAELQLLQLRCVLEPPICVYLRSVLRRQAVMVWCDVERAFA